MFNPHYYNIALKKISKRYLLVNILAKRIRQLQRGADPLVEIEEGNQITAADIALKEIAEGKIFLKKIEEEKKHNKNKKSGHAKEK
ncbi:MAG: DNA-directed RNA polymerase subunit omega [Nitrospinae bacterium]|nr:DNA-directed RNA polymerase subunit omega [Nitrospinota bacterium]